MARVSRWGNSLAVRLPAAMVEQLDLKEGDEVRLSATNKGEVQVTIDERRRKALAAMAKLNWTLPSDYKFDREEANSRKS